ncbi:polysaccharide deacetylase family protein [Marinobacter confluentis]|uniref:Polysaccharide deacetylase n=1 Tax=Marinobacter confluentis TaxID=1697557 RepID=A0A4Z1C523_9GAMM|nr:polysaccharide deacetylase family protein [Marinobacter confluentis]TGN41521.1 polysaccharide deacetylase [Marinobacter confluentis]
MNFSPFVKFLGQWGGYKFAQRLTAYHPRMLMYHRFTTPESDSRVLGVSAERFEEQVAYIARHHNPITVTEMIRGCFEGEKLPRHAIAITVDDGYEDFYRIAWPILRRYKVPATFYVTTGFVDGRLWLWPDQLSWILDNARASGISLRPFVNDGESVVPPSTNEEKQSLFSRLVGYLLHIPDEKKHAFLRAIAAQWEIHVPESAPDWASPVTWAQLAEMQTEGLEVGGHTVTHPSLSQVGLGQARNEIFGARDALVANLGDRPRSFCYPNGTQEDFVAEQVPIIRQANFTGAVVAFADAQGQSQRYAMRRHSSSDNMFQFLKAVSGVEHLGHKLRNTRRSTVYE